MNPAHTGSTNGCTGKQRPLPAGAAEVKEACFQTNKNDMLQVPQDSAVCTSWATAEFGTLNQLEIEKG